MHKYKLNMLICCTEKFKIMINVENICAASHFCGKSDTFYFQDTLINREYNIIYFKQIFLWHYKCTTTLLSLLINLTHPCRINFFYYFFLLFMLVYLICFVFCSFKGTNNTLTCMEDGLWSFPEALCELRCPVPPLLPNAMLQTKRCNETGLKVGTLCKYKCKPGYHVANKPKRFATICIILKTQQQPNIMCFAWLNSTLNWKLSRLLSSQLNFTWTLLQHMTHLCTCRRAFKRQCTEDGRWLEGSCEPVTCPPPPSVFYGMYQCTNGFKFDSTCWIHCNGANNTLRQPPCKQVTFDILL